MKRILALLIFFTAVAVAQPARGMFAWWDSPLAKDLNLTDDQTKQIQATVSAYRSRLIDARSAVEKAEGEMEDAFNEAVVDQRKATDAIEKLASARAELTRSISLMSLKLRGTLTAEQWAELQKRRHRMQPGMGGPGMQPGGPGGQPGGGQRYRQKNPAGGGITGPSPAAPPPPVE